MVGLPDGKEKLSICSALSTEYQHVTDRRMDRHLATV